MQAMTKKATCGLAGLLIGATTAAGAWADTPASPPEKQRWHPNTAETAVIFEAAAVLNGELAASAPKAFGAVEVFISPAASELGGNGAERWTAGLSMASIGAYNIRHESSEYSRGQVVRANVLALNAMAVAMFVADKLGGGPAAEQVAEHVSITAQPEGGMRLGYRWSF